MQKKRLPVFLNRYIRRRGTLFVVSGPSGCGKTTLCDRLLKKKSGLVRSVSVTTRGRRGKEKPSRDYIYVSVPEFKKQLAKGAFLEHAEVFGHYYATPGRFVEESLSRNHDVLMNIDVQGAAQIKDKFKQAVLIFILPPTMEALKTRLKKRSSDAPAQIRKRLVLARRELTAIGIYDYVVINDRVDKAVRRLASIVTAARLRIRNKGSSLNITT
jgi:guanylate kinase